MSKRQILRGISFHGFPIIVPIEPAYLRKGISQSHKRKLYWQWASQTKPPDLFPRFLPFNAKFK